MTGNDPALQDVPPEATAPAEPVAPPDPVAPPEAAAAAPVEASTPVAGVAESAPVHPYYRAEPGTAWASFDQFGKLLPAHQALVTLANWQEDPYLTWSFQHMRELMPSHVIDGNDEPRPLPEEPRPIGRIPVTGPIPGTVDDVIEQTNTDGWLVIHQGAIVDERYYGTLNRRRRHLLMSVTKSVVSCVAATLHGEGLLEPDGLAETYVPELATCGYSGATVRDLLDMRSGVRFSEGYLDPFSELRVMERSMGWAPRNHGDPLGMYPFILTSVADRPHRGIFEYRSLETDVLGWVLERIAGDRMADLISTRVWHPMGAFHDGEITVDPLGSAIHDGGMSATLRDLGRFGLLLAEGGRNGDLQVVPQAWLDDAADPPAEVRQAFADSVNEPFMPGGWYRNQFWFLPGDDGPIQLCLGIHGQMVFVDRASGTVGAKLSSWPLPQDGIKLPATVAAFRAIAAELAGRPQVPRGADPFLG